ncbi:hypothetical protein OH783_01685 [Kocuria rhizophila]|uniref:hypothetical protein n=1 Tax=Kocuria rhizophila TaxID=72000 RepID=UPI00386BEA2C|nr:hypothetical protein OH783_01685 [Kocuria rhizophila]WSZ54148.1 hypothetical protein OG926_01685 [Kocuria rhizophila]
MTRTITPAEIKPGMTIRWTHNKVTYECPVMDRDGTDEDGGVLCHVSDMHSEYVDAEAGEVTVLSEPQPEEPTEFGAKVRVRKGRFVRLVEGDAGFLVWFEEGTESWWTWDELCEMGPVTVVPDQGWEVPADAPEVPDRIEEWPEDDTALRPYKWRGRDGYIWKWLAAASEWECYDAVGNGMVSGGRPSYGPWTRATDA